MILFYDKHQTNLILEQIYNDDPSFSKVNNPGIETDTT